MLVEEKRQELIEEYRRCISAELTSRAIADRLAAHKKDIAEQVTLLLNAFTEGLPKRIERLKSPECKHKDSELLFAAAGRIVDELWNVKEVRDKYPQLKDIHVSLIALETCSASGPSLNVSANAARDNGHDNEKTRNLTRIIDLCATLNEATE